MQNLGFLFDDFVPLSRFVYVLSLILYFTACLWLHVLLTPTLRANKVNYDNNNLY
jgi:hypothetical protein